MDLSASLVKLVDLGRKIPSFVVGSSDDIGTSLCVPVHE
jgi:hypothetical protein